MRAGRRTKRLGALLLAGELAACATAKPVLYANEKYRQVGGQAAARDIAECEALANQADATPGAGKAGEAAKSAGVGAVAGAAAGAVGGAITGAPGTGAAVGAASGAVWALFAWMFGWMNPSRPSDVHMNYVDMCLAERGYQVAGWQ